MLICKIKTNLNKLEKIQSKIKRKKWRNMSRNSLHKKMVLERFDEHLPFFKFIYDFNAFENLYKLLTIR